MMTYDVAIVDDDESFIKLLELDLKNIDLVQSIRIFNTVESFLEDTNQYHIIFCDQCFADSEAQGLDLFHKYKDVDNVEFVLMSSMKEYETLKTAIVNDLQFYMEKPIKRATLFNTLIDIDRKIRNRMKDEAFLMSGKMSTQIIHEIRNPIASLLINVESISMEIENLLQELGETVGDSKEYILEDLDSVKNNIIKTNEIIDVVVDFYKGTVQNRNKDSICIDQFMANLISFYGENSNRHFEDIHFTKTSNNFEGYETILKIVLRNLVNNSIDAYSENSLKGSININWNNNEIIYEDEAGGVEKDVIDSLFSDKLSTKAKGLGLGLQFSYNILKLLEIELSYERFNEKGSRFIIKIKN